MVGVVAFGVFAAAGTLIAARAPGAGAGKGGLPATGLSLTIYDPTGGAAAAGGLHAQPQMSMEGAPPQAGAAFALVTDRRKLALTAGENDVRFEGVSDRLDPATVSFTDLTDPAGTIVREQRFEYDGASVDRLLEKGIGQKVTVATDDGVVSGTLLAVDPGSLAIRAGDGVRIVTRGKGVRDVRLESVGTIAVRPTLRFQVTAKTGGEHLIEVGYQTGGVGWSADYTLVLSPDRKKGELEGWLTVANETGAAFEHASLRLVAGDVFRGAPAIAVDPNTGLPMRPPGPPGDPLPVPGTPTLEAGGVVQLPLAPRAAITGQTVLVYDPLARVAPYLRSQGYPNVDQGAFQYGGQPGQPGAELYFEAQADPKAHVGLPAGRARIYRRGDDGALVLLVEGPVEASGPGPEKGRPMRFRLETVTDLGTERRQVSFRVDDRTHEMVEELALTLKNHRKEPIEVVVVERMFRWTTWTMETESQPSEKDVADGTARYRVKLPAGGEQTITYRVQYSW